MASMEKSINVRQHQLKTTSMEDDLDERQPQLNNWRPFLSTETIRSSSSALLAPACFIHEILLLPGVIMTLFLFKTLIIDPSFEQSFIFRIMKESNL